MARPTLEPQTELSRRLCAVRQALDFKERKHFAEQLGILASTLGNYETGAREPPASVLTLYKNWGVSGDWLLTGEGQMFSDPTLAVKSAQPVVPELLERLYKLVEETAKEHNYRLSASQMSHEAAQLYNELINRITDITDTEEIAVIIPQIKYLYSKRLAKSKPENTASNVA